MPLPVSAPLARSDSAVFSELDDQVVMLDSRAGRYYELDAIGARIWMLLKDRPTLAQLRDALTAEYDVDDETCLGDLVNFLEELVGLGLVAVDSEEAADQ